jgi:hypothetical protein
MRVSEVAHYIVAKITLLESVLAEEEWDNNRFLIRAVIRTPFRMIEFAQA